MLNNYLPPIKRYIKRSFPKTVWLHFRLQYLWPVLLFCISIWTKSSLTNSVRFATWRFQQHQNLCSHIWWYHLLSSNLTPDKLEPIRDWWKIVISIPPKFGIFVPSMRTFYTTDAEILNHVCDLCFLTGDKLTIIYSKMTADQHNFISALSRRSNQIPIRHWPTTNLTMTPCHYAVMQQMINNVWRNSVRNFVRLKDLYALWMCKSDVSNVTREQQNLLPTPSGVCHEFNVDW